MANDQQPHGTQQMSERPTDGMVKKFSEGAAKEAGKQTVSGAADASRNYLDENPNTVDDAQARAQQQYDDAQAQAKGAFAKFCPCFA